MKKEEAGISLRKPKQESGRVSALSSDHEKEGRQSALSKIDRQSSSLENERTRLLKEQLLEKLKYVDPVRANSCKSLREATKAISHLMERVEYRLMEKKVDGMRNAASTYTTKKSGEITTAL